MRAKQQNHKLAKEDFRQKLVEWHLTTREKLVWTNIGQTYDQKWGSFLPNQCFNVDQSPMPFATDMKQTYHLYEPGQHQYQEKCGFPSLAVGSKNISAPCRYVFVLTEQPRIGMFKYNIYLIDDSLATKEQWITNALFLTHNCTR